MKQGKHWIVTKGRKTQLCKNYEHHVFRQGILNMVLVIRCVAIVMDHQPKVWVTGSGTQLALKPDCIIKKVSWVARERSIRREMGKACGMCPHHRPGHRFGLNGPINGLHCVLIKDFIFIKWLLSCTFSVPCGSSLLCKQ